MGVEIPNSYGANPADANASSGLHGLIGGSAAMREVYSQIKYLAASRANIFISGESGTGKQACAEAIHRASPRSSAPFVTVSCAAMPPELIERRIFGDPSETAPSGPPSALRAADRGTLFLDEVSALPLPLQGRLLRFLQSGMAGRTLVDVRLICSSSRPMLEELASGQFREDLYYRLAVVPLDLPPLRDRGGDIEALAQSFLRRFAREHGKKFNPLGAEHLAALEAYSWPGNLQELQNVIRRAILLFDGPELPLRALPAIPPTPQGQSPQPVEATGDAPAATTTDHEALFKALAGLTLDQIERLAIEGAIRAAHGSLPGAARILGVSPSTLYRKRERWNDAQRSA
ncbi:sigma 54-interacting transcriptional regulator [Novosphingobium sp. KACC 22771]|uniref:sigma 54-interacting transcriptional regulator n=1 Tax=Novosphingobium sp. KACC 22771 TaxID=3025670 RepID=UPI0023665DEB|nr:sigma-54 dependent transcriptional regulator [Novosphingobium sp. KACC 22771]WDF72029.1 sigma-54 dependent transcriptional regulator [Novosphingobium sp. KACC 22771]